jgi:hypothetical protein
MILTKTISCVHHSKAIAYSSPANKPSSAVDSDPPDRRSCDRTPTIIAITHSFMDLDVSRRDACLLHCSIDAASKETQAEPRAIGSEIWVDIISAAVPSRLRLIKAASQVSPIPRPVCYTLIINSKTFTLASTCRFAQISAWTPPASRETPTSTPITSRPMSSSWVPVSAACTSCTNSATS